jgi:hypothetical protein
MPYIGRGLGPQGAFRILDDLSLSSHTSGGFNGSRTTFALTVGTASLTVGLPETLIIAVDGVIQEPGSAYTISGSNIVFTAAPQADATFWGVELGDVGGIAKSIADGTITTDSLASGVLDTNISSVSGSDDTLASAKSIKTYVDAQVTAQDLDATTDSGTIDIDLDSETLTIAGGEGIDTSASGTTITIAGEEASTSNKGVASFHSDNFAVSSGVVTIKNAGVAIAEIATTSGTAGSDTFLRGDGQWQAAGGDLSFGGDTFGADKVIGSNDAYSLSFETAGVVRMKIHGPVTSPTSAGAITMPTQPCVLYYNSVSTTSATGNNTTIPVDFDTEVIDQGGDFASNTFTAPVTGQYQINVLIRLANIDGAADVGIGSIVTANHTYGARLDHVNSMPDEMSFMVSTIADMDANTTATATVVIAGSGSDNATLTGGSQPVTYFSACLLA